MALPGNGSVLTTASIYQLTAPGSINAQATVNATLASLAPLGNSLFIADQLSINSGATFSTTTTNGVTTESITYPSAGAPGGSVTIPNVTLVNQGSSGFTFSSSNGGTYYLSNTPVGGSQVDVNTSNNPLLSVAAGTLDTAVGPNPTLFVGATNTPTSLDGQAYIACFLRGTLIATSEGEQPVETLAIGTQVRTASGACRPVLWIGRRSYARAFVGLNPMLVPVRIAAGAIEESLPRRDLYLSPCHAVLIDGMLVPAAELVNQVTITRAERFETIDYFHIEVEDHDVILAEGVACETFVDHDSRMAFQNAAEYYELYPDREECEPVFYAPRVIDGPALESLRERLASRARDVDLQRVA